MARKVKYPSNNFLILRKEFQSLKVVRIHLDNFFSEKLIPSYTDRIIKSLERCLDIVQKSDAYITLKIHFNF